jgi:pimeloyl-ACP methyl ester carboxylesterase
VRLEDGVVHYELSGPADGPVVVLVNGFSAPYFVWDPAMRALTDGGFRVLRYDLYGRGYSDRPEVNYDLALFIRQIDQLLAALHIDGPVQMGGLSFGGLAAAAFANRHPEKVGSLVLIDPQAANVSAGDISPLAVPLVGEYLMHAYIGPVRLAQTQGSDFFRPENFLDFKEQYREPMQYKGFKRAILSSLRELVGVDPILEYAAVGRSGLPVLLIWGEQDRTVKADGIRKVQGALPDAEFHAIPQAGHLSHYEQPGVVNPLIAAFLERNRRQP